MIEVKGPGGVREGNGVRLEGKKGDVLEKYKFLF
jgi:hypothetical protein